MDVLSAVCSFARLLSNDVDLNDKIKLPLSSVGDNLKVSAKVCKKRVPTISKHDFPKIAELRDELGISFSEIALLFSRQKNCEVTQKQVRNIYDYHYKSGHKRNAHLKWNEDKIRLLVVLRNEQKTFKQISKVFNESFGVVKSRENFCKKYSVICKKLGAELSSEVVLPEDISFLVKKRKDTNFSGREIAQIFSSGEEEKSEQKEACKISSICKPDLNIHQVSSSKNLRLPKSKKIVWNRTKLGLLNELRSSGKSYLEISKVFCDVYGIEQESAYYRMEYNKHFQSGRSCDEIAEKVSEEGDRPLKKWRGSFASTL
jgi:hypothetical protein